jgi:hypothetical protein
VEQEGEECDLEHVITLTDSEHYRRKKAGAIAKIMVCTITPTV